MDLPDGQKTATDLLWVRAVLVLRAKSLPWIARRLRRRAIQPRANRACRTPRPAWSNCAVTTREFKPSLLTDDGFDSLN